MPNLSPLFLNNVVSTVQAGSSAIGSATATGINVATGDGANFGTIGTNQFIPAMIVDTSTTPTETVKEYVYITARTTDALTVVRQAEDSSRYTASTTSIQAGYTIAAVYPQSSLRAGFDVRPTGMSARDYGLLTWTFDPAESAGNTQAVSTLGSVQLNRVQIPYTMTVTNILFVKSSTTAGLTSGQNFAGIYDSTGTRLGVTADQTTAWAGSGAFTMPISGGPITITGGADVFAWIALLCNGSTRVTGPWAATISATSALQPTLTASTARSAHAGSALTSLPTSITPSSNTIDNNLLWFGLS